MSISATPYNKKFFTFFFIAFSFFYSIECFSQFKVYDATLYKNKPNLEKINIHSIPIIYENTFFSNKKKDSFPSSANLRKAASTINKSNSNLVVLDIERWETKGNDDLIYKSVFKYKKVIEALRKQGVKSLMGYYGLPPIRDYWRAIKDINSDDYLSWQKDNDKVQTLTEITDILYPSLYTFYSDQDGWKKYAIAQISEAKRLGGNKPVIVFLWPQYHDSNMLLKGRYISKKFWRLQLNTVFKYADGLIIWGGWKENWDSNAPWWKETIQFIKDHNLK